MPASIRNASLFAFLASVIIVSAAVMTRSPSSIASSSSEPAIAATASRWQNISDLTACSMDAIDAPELPRPPLRSTKNMRHARALAAFHAAFQSQRHVTSTPR